MAARSPEAAPGNVTAWRRTARRTGARPARSTHRHRLLVIAPGVRETVEHAGGLLFDRVLAGWDVTVLVADRSDTRALRILGVDAEDLEAELPALHRRPQPEVLVAAAGLCGADDRVRRLVGDAITRGAADIRIWGAPCVTRESRSEHAIGPAHHRLSLAARAFKTHALAAVSAAHESIDTVETFAAAGETP